MRRVLPLLLVLAACEVAAPPGPSAPDPTEQIWAEGIQPGTLIVAVPGTGAYDDVGSIIDASGSGVLDWRTNHGFNPIVLEQAIAAAQRAGLSNADIEAGAVGIAIWGSGATKVPGFAYHSLGGLTVHVDVLGGMNAAATGSLQDNLLNYSADHAKADAADLVSRAVAAAGGRPMAVVAHSWGGAIVEYMEQDAPLPGAVLAVTAGVPKVILDYDTLGPGLHAENGAQLYEVDRPDDPVHQLDPSGDIEGHQYDIMFGDAFQGSYGITTTELSCRAMPGPCAD
jgi:hypothetical protein